MIHVLYDHDKCELQMTGHAQTAQRGKDLLCCAASTLALTYQHVCESLDKMGATTEGAELLARDGSFRARVFPKEEALRFAQIKLDTIVEGLIMLEESAPQNISVTVKG